MKFPSPKLVCKKIKIYPVQHKNTILKLKDSNIVADCGSKTIAINQCEATVCTTLCKTTSTPTCAIELKPTFNNDRGTSFIDVTFVSRVVVASSIWMFHEDITLSDHNLITFGARTMRPSPKQRRCALGPV